VLPGTLLPLRRLVLILDGESVLLHEVNSGGFTSEAITFAVDFAMGDALAAWITGMVKGRRSRKMALWRRPSTTRLRATAISGMQ
jgi:phage-related protein